MFEETNRSNNIPTSRYKHNSTVSYPQRSQGMNSIYDEDEVNYFKTDDDYLYDQRVANFVEREKLN